ncbi:MAG: hypothetical protein KAY46_08225 [Burkholderiaceae bacterium]|nr:hypothetical protein [Burkholderiaceae bacterium]
MSESTIRRYTDALVRHDGTALLSCYHRHASFSDPIHPDVRAERVGWLMRFRLARLEQVQADTVWLAGDERKAQMLWRVRWRARRGAGREAGREVGRTRARSLRVLSTFTLWEDEIVRQVDEFAPWAYLRQVHGLPGLALGWLPARLDAERERAAQALDRFIAGQPRSDSPRPGVELAS